MPPSLSHTTVSDQFGSSVFSIPPSLNHHLMLLPEVPRLVLGVGVSAISMWVGRCVLVGWFTRWLPAPVSLSVSASVTVVCFLVSDKNA